MARGERGAEKGKREREGEDQSRLREIETGREGEGEGGKANDAEEEERKTEQMRDSWRGQASRHLRETALHPTCYHYPCSLSWLPRSSVSPQASWKVKKKK